MSSDHDEATWLNRLPVDALVGIDGKSVRLRVSRNGAGLEATLLPNYTYHQLQQALNQGFSSAILFEAGLGLAADSNTLVLNQWLPGVACWRDARQALEKLLNQLDGWLDILKPQGTDTGARSTNTEDRQAKRLRSLIASGK